MENKKIFEALNYCVGKLEAMDKKIDSLHEYMLSNESRIKNLEARCEKIHANTGAEHTY